MHVLYGRDDQFKNWEFCFYSFIIFTDWVYHAGFGLGLQEKTVDSIFCLLLITTNNKRVEHFRKFPAGVQSELLIFAFKAEHYQEETQYASSNFQFNCSFI